MSVAGGYRVSRRAVIATLIGAVGVGSTALFAGTASLWYDEAATVSAAHRSLSQLVGMLGNVDAVHTGYYMLMHGWLSMSAGIGLSETGLRLPSAIAIGFASAGTCLLTTKFGAIHVGCAAAILFLFLPRVQWAGAEARPYAFTIALAIGVMLAAVTAVQRGTARSWAIFTVASVIAALWFILCVTVVVAVVVWIAISHRDRIRAALVSSAASLVICAPFALWVHSQDGQVSWIPQFSWRSVGDYLTQEFFMVDSATIVSASVCGAAVCMLMVIGIYGAWRNRYRSLVVLGVAWMCAPAIMIFTYSTLVTPTYVPRYLAFTAPGTALIAAAGCAQLIEFGRNRWAAQAAIFMAVVLTVVGSGQYAALIHREPYGKTGGTDFSQAAHLVGKYSNPGDCVGFQQHVSWSPQSHRLLVRAFPRDFHGLRLAPAESAVDRNALWDGLSTQSPAWIASCTVLWIVADENRQKSYIERPEGGTVWMFAVNDVYATPVVREALKAGMRTIEQVNFNHSQVLRMVR